MQHDEKLEDIILQSDVISSPIDVSEIPDLLAGVKKCTCRLWQEGEIFTRLTMCFHDISASLQNNILRIDFMTKDRDCALSVDGSVISATAETDGRFFDICLVLAGNTEVHIFTEKI